MASRDDDKTVPFKPHLHGPHLARAKRDEGPAPRAPGGDDDLLPEGLVVGEYEIIRHLDSGGMAAVYAGKHPLIGKEVAIKVLSRVLSGDPVMVDRFVQEARAVNQIRHHNIVDIFALGQLSDGRVYCVMELLSGESLHRRLRREPGLGYDDALSILSQVCDGLEAAHAVKIVHRDLKPDNVFLVKTPHGPAVKLLDFGVAKLLGSESPGRAQTRAGMLIGTPEYMAPEQCHGQAVDTRTDVYALGVMMYEMFAGRLPFDASSPLMMISAHADTPPADPRQFGVDGQLAEVILACLAKAPDDRPQTVGEVRERLTDVLEERQVQLVTPVRKSGVRGVATPSGRVSLPRRSESSLPPPKTVSSRSGRIARLAGAGLILALAALGAIVVIGTIRKESEGARPAATLEEGSDPARPTAATDPLSPSLAAVPAEPAAIEPADPTPEPAAIEPAADVKKEPAVKTGTPSVIRDLTLRPTVAWQGEKTIVSGTVAFEDPDGDVKSLGIESRASDGSGRNRANVPLRLSGAPRGTAAFSFLFSPSVTGTHTVEVSARDEGGNVSARLSGTIEVMERDDPAKEKAPDDKAKAPDPKAKPADPKAKPADPKAKPADSKAKPADPKAKPADPKAKPADPKASPQPK